MRRSLATLVVVAFLMCALVARAQVLDQVPAEALVVVKVNNLQGFSTKLGKFCTDLQLTAQVPQLADPLGSLQEKLKIPNGLDKSGDAVFAFLEPAVAGGDSDNSVLLLWPVSDYNAFIGNFPDAKTDGGITEAKFADSDKPAFIANWGKFAAMSPSKEVVSLKPTGLKLTGVTAKEMASKDVCMLANIPRLRAIVQPELEGAKRDEKLADIEKNMTGDVEKYVPAVKALVSQLFVVADSFFRDAQAATLSLNFGENGINSTMMAEFEPSSYIGQMAKNLKNSQGSMLTGLPAGKYLFFGGSVNDPATVAKVMDDFMAPIKTELDKLGGKEADAINKYVASFRSFMNATHGGSFGWVAPTGALGQEPIIQIISVNSGDAAAMKTAYQDMITSQQMLATAFGAPEGTVKTATTPNAKTIDGISFDLTHTDMNLGQGANAAQADNMMKMIYGPEGMNVLTGIVGEKLVIGFCATDQTLSQTIAATKAGEDALSKTPGVAAVNSQLPTSRVMTLYIPLDDIATTVGTYAGAMGMPIQIQLPPDLPPVGMTVASDGSAIRVDSYTSTDLIKALVAQGMQLYMQRMGGGAPGGPGGL
jgi:hypothetical protein